MNKKLKDYTDSELIAKLEAIQRKLQIRQEFLTTTFRTISNEELLKELQKRVGQTIELSMNLSMNSNPDYISITGRDGKCLFIVYLPIEIKKKDQNV